MNDTDIETWLDQVTEGNSPNHERIMKGLQFHFQSACYIPSHAASMLGDVVEL